MALSDTARRVLTEAAQHPLRLAAPPDRLPAAACRAVLTNLLKQGYVEECEAPDEHVGLGWRRKDGAVMMARVTAAGMAAIDAVPADTDLKPTTTPTATAEHALTDAEDQDTAPEPADTTQEPGSAPLAAPAAPEDHDEGPTGAEAAQAPSTRTSLRDVAHHVLAVWEDEAGERAGLPDAIAALRTILMKPAPVTRTAGPRKPREGTKQQQVLAMLRRPEGATVAQIAEATGWQAHTVRGLFAGLKKRGIEVSALERVRQVGPGKEGAKGSYTVYRVSEAVEG